MTISGGGDGGAVTLKVKACRLDAAHSDRFRDDVQRKIREGERHIILDFSSVEFMDSTALGALVGCLKQIGDGGAIEILDPQERVTRFLKRTRMDRIFPLRHRSDCGVVDGPLRAARHAGSR